MSNLDANAILLSLLVGSIGFVAFVYGKRQGRIPHVLVGLTLMIYPYFVPNLIASSIVAVVLLAGLWGVVRLGW